VPSFEQWATASGAVVAILPIRAENQHLEAAVAFRGYEPASDWLVKDLAS
jgi:hypothetical protein